MQQLQLFNTKVSDGHVLGCFSKTTDSSLVEAMAYAGLDFVILDMEHGPINYETLKHHIIASDASGILPVVRVPSCTSEAIGKCLDLGARAIQVPSVSDKADAIAAVNRAKFHPLGARGVCRFVRAAQYGTSDRNQYFDQSNENLLILQLEGQEGLRNFDEIILTEGIDIIFIGPYDLSQSLGIPGDIENTKVVDEIKRMIQLAKEKNITLGTFCDSKEQLIKWRESGIKYLAYSVDINIFIEGVKEIKGYISNEN